MDRQPEKIVAGILPKYRQLLLILREQILSGKIAPGERIPSEEELITTYGLSRGTVRKVIAQIEAERLIDTEHGIGSFVRLVHPNALPFRFLPVPEESGTAAYQIAAQERVPAPLAVAEKLKIAPGTPVLRVARRRLLGGEAVCYTERYLLQDILPELLEQDLAQVPSIHDLLLNSSEYPLLRAEIEVEAHLLSPEEAGLLAAQAGASAIVVQRLSYTAPNRPAVWYYGLFLRRYALEIGLV